MFLLEEDSLGVGGGPAGAEKLGLNASEDREGPAWREEREGETREGESKSNRKEWLN